VADLEATVEDHDDPEAETAEPSKSENPAESQQLEDVQDSSAGDQR
jgi:hypothetical protein